MANPIRGNKPKNLRSHNIKAILSLLRQENELTIRDISKHIQLSVTTTNKIVNNLVQRGIMISAGKGSSSAEGGKCPERFSLNPNYSYFILCSLGYTTSKIILLDLTAQIRDEIVLYTDSITNHGYEAVLQNISSTVNQIVEKNQLKSEQIYRIILSTVGITNPAEGIIHDSFVTSWGKNIRICRDLTKKLSVEIPVYLDNANVFIGYAETLNSPDTKKSYWVLLKNDAVVSFDSKEPVRGSLGYTGNFNNMIIDTGTFDFSRIDKLDRKNTFSYLVSEEALCSYVIERKDHHPKSVLQELIENSTLKAADVFQAADQGDGLAREAVDIVVRWFYIECLNLIVLYNPQRIVIQGLYRQAGQYFMSQLIALKKFFPTYETAPSYEICYSNFSEKLAEATGAGLYIFQHFFVNSF